jgi:type VI secretion system Hcp family effector
VPPPTGGETVAIYMRYGDVIGDATIKLDKQTGWINVQAFEWDVKRAITNKPAGHGHTTDVKRPSMEPFKITKETDLASTQLLEKMCRSHKPERCTIRFVRTGIENTYAEYTFHDSLIKEIGINAKGGGPPEETVTFAFVSVEVKVYPGVEHNEKGDSPPFHRYNLVDGE